MPEDRKQKLLEALFAHATESIIVTDNKGAIILMNPAAENNFGYTQSEIMGKTVEYLMPERFALNHVAHRGKFNNNPHKRSMGIGMDLFAKKKNGTEFPVEISLTPFSFEEQRYVIAFIIDITKRKIVESTMIEQQKKVEAMADELRTSNEKLETKVNDRTKILQEALTALEKSKKELSETLKKEKELNEMKSRFLSMASHEFRTPLTAILSSASLIEEYPNAEQQEKRVRHIDRIKSGVNNLNDILSDFLSISKIEEGKVIAELKNFNLKNLTADIVSEMKGLVKPGQQILHNHFGTENAFLDQKLVRNILINLVSNALKFSDENKTVTIKTKVDKENIELCVKDQGMGISDEDKKHLFERFFRGHNATNVQGTGLGLNIVGNYAELLNGKIEFESELEKGTTFTVTFPNNQL